ncbi:MAG TPA: succinate dehydrogenase assembly factor 2 [Pseudomonadales bacterium]
MTETESAQWRRVQWHSRRGMLELDLALVPFVEQLYPQLTERDQAVYRRLLECEDTELFAWVLQKERPADAELADMVDRIISHARQVKD